MLDCHTEQAQCCPHERSRRDRGFAATLSLLHPNAADDDVALGNAALIRPHPAGQPRIPDTPRSARASARHHCRSGNECRPSRQSRRRQSRYRSRSGLAQRYTRRRLRERRSVGSHSPEGQRQAVRQDEVRHHWPAARYARSEPAAPAGRQTVACFQELLTNAVCGIGPSVTEGSCVVLRRSWCVSASSAVLPVVTRDRSGTAMAPGFGLGP